MPKGSYYTEVKDNLPINVPPFGQCRGSFQQAGRWINAWREFRHLPSQPQTRTNASYIVDLAMHKLMALQDPWNSFSQN